MRSKRAKRPPSPPIPGLVPVSMKLPEGLRNSMRTLRQIRREIELGDVSLCRLYREAVEYYLAAKPQRELLERRRARTADGRPDPEIQEWLQA